MHIVQGNGKVNDIQVEAPNMIRFGEITRENDHRSAVMEIVGHGALLCRGEFRQIQQVQHAI